MGEKRIQNALLTPLPTTRKKEKGARWIKNILW